MSSLLANDPVFFRLRGPVLPPGDEAKKMLGRVVRNFAQPLGAGYCPEDGSEFAIAPPTETKWLKASDVFVRSAGGSIELRLGGVAGGRAELDGAGAFSLTNSEVLAMELRHQPEVYRKLLGDQAVGAWIRANCSVNRPLFMITGLLVWRDAVQKESSAHNFGGQAAVNAPVGAAAMAAATSGAALPIGSVGDVKGEVAGHSFQFRSQERESENSQVFAVEYKIIRRRKRLVLSGFAPVFQDTGPSIVADRQYGSRVSASSGGEQSLPDGGKDDVPELEIDLPWVDVLDEAAEIKSDTVEADGNFVEFVTAE